MGRGSLLKRLVSAACLASAIGMLGASAAGAAMFGSGEFVSAAVRDDGTLWTWGENHGLGALGDGSFDLYGRTSPGRVGTDADWTAVAVGGQHLLALKTDGTLWAWGSNEWGQCGVDKHAAGFKLGAPTQVGGDGDWAAVAAGYRFSLALKTDGSLWAWGENTNGNVGNGETCPPDPFLACHPTVPVRIGTAADWASVTASWYLSGALRADGTVWTWGNHYAEAPVVPTPVSADSDWAAASAGSRHFLALKTDGTIWAWGDNGFGAFGTGRAGDPAVIEWVASPVPGPRGSDWAGIGAGNGISLGMKADGTLWAWGANPSQTLGVGSGKDPVTRPSQVLGGLSWGFAAGGMWCSQGRGLDGVLYAWGFNFDGVLGDGTTETRTSPVPVMALGGATECADGDFDGYSPDGGGCGPVDCDDADPGTNPGAAEVCFDLADNDCDGKLDCADRKDCGKDTYCR